VGVVCALVFGSGVSGLNAALADSTQPPFQVVIHPQNPESALTREFLTEAFLKKTTRWPTGAQIRPVDLRFDSPVRYQFSERVLRRSVSAVRSYWQQRIFSGRGVPPPEVESDAAVVRYVKQHPGGVGYVSGRADTSELKVLTVR
jgi:ABC-type phosphate transport system substrate-binding protein